VPDAPPPLRLSGSLIHMYSRKVHAVYYAHFTWHSRTWIRDILTGTPEFRNCKAIYRLARRSHLDSITSIKSYTPEAEIDGWDRRGKRAEIDGWDRRESYSPRLLSRSTHVSSKCKEKGSHKVSQLSILHMKTWYGDTIWCMRRDGN